MIHVLGLNSAKWIQRIHLTNPTFILKPTPNTHSGLNDLCKYHFISKPTPNTHSDLNDLHKHHSTKHYASIQ